MKVAITGGHHSSALPVIAQLRKLDSQIQFIWFGHKHSLKGDKNPTLEYKEITDLGIPFINLHAGKVYRTFDITRLLKVPYGFIEAFFYMLNNRPNVILSFGGYLAVPVVVAGWFLGIPSITHEQTLVVGYANKVISIFAKKILISWEQSAKYFPKDKVLFTGLPLREEIFSSNSNNFSVNQELPTVYITAGKTGSHKINQIINECLSELLSFCNVIHQCGDNSVNNDFDLLSATYSKMISAKGKYFVRKFVLGNEIGEVFSKAALVISRAGAHIVSELYALQKPSILIPISWVSHDEQNVNARYLEQKGLAVILDEKNLSSPMLLNQVKEQLSKTHEMSEISRNTNSAVAIAHEVIKFQKK